MTARILSIAAIVVALVCAAVEATAEPARHQAIEFAQK